MPTIKYILFCAQECNFLTRSLLIPYDLIITCEERVGDLDILRANAKKNVVFEHEGKEYIVDNLLIQNVTYKDKLGIYDNTPFLQIVEDFIFYAFTMEDGFYCKEYDMIWADGAIPRIASDSNPHFVNYCEFRNRTEYKGMPIEIVEGFLILESSNGHLEGKYQFNL